MQLLLCTESFVLVLNSSDNHINTACNISSSVTGKTANQYKCQRELKSKRSPRHSDQIRKGCKDWKPLFLQINTVFIDFVFE